MPDDAFQNAPHSASPAADPTRSNPVPKCPQMSQFQPRTRSAASRRNHVGFMSVPCRFDVGIRPPKTPLHPHNPCPYHPLHSQSTSKRPEIFFRART